MQTDLNFEVGLPRRGDGLDVVNELIEPAWRLRAFGGQAPEQVRGL